MTTVRTYSRYIVPVIALSIIILNAAQPINVQARDTQSVSDTIINRSTEPVNPADSTHTLLPGVDVTASRSFHSANMSTYTPTRRERNVATDATHLLEHMQIPQLKLDANGKMVSTQGKQVTYFIDGHPAQEYDLQGMNTRDVKKICILENPSDPKYLGSELVVDFIMQNYEYGGYTKFMESTHVLGMLMANEQVSSRFTYRRMTFDLYAAASNSRYDRFATASTETLHLQDGIVVKKKNPDKSGYRNDKYPVKFRTRYKKGNTYISNQLGYQYSTAPRYYSRGTIGITEVEDVYDYDYRLSLPNSNHTATWNGNASFIFDGGWSLAASGYTYFTHYKSDYEYNTTEPADIDRRIKENSLESRLNAELGKSIGKSSIGIEAWGLVLSSHSDYCGDMNAKSDFLFPTVGGKLSYSYNSNNIYLSAYTGVAAEWNRINDISISTVYPYGVAILRYSPNRGSALSLWIQYTTYSASGDNKNPTLIQKNELFYIKGNPDLNTYKKFELCPSYTYSPSGKFDLTATMMYTHFHNKISNTYTLTDDGDAVLQSYVNRGNTDVLYALVSGNLRLLDNRLRISATPQITVYRGHNVEMPDLNAFGFQGNAAYYMGSFYVGANVNIQNRHYDDYEMNSLLRKKPQYYLYAGWGNSHWSAVVYARNIFRRSWDNSTSYVYSPVYDNSISQITTNLRQTIYATLTYTFGYGKKIGARNELNGEVSRSQSAVLQ